MDTDGFCNDLQKFFFSQPYGSISKTDLQEKLFFLFDEYSENSLTKLSDYELGLKLKCTRQKAAALKASVTAKFGEPFKITDYNAFCDEFFQLKAYPSKEPGEFCIAIESSKIRDFLDYIFLVELHRAIEYKNNRTLVVIDFDSYRSLLGVLKNRITDSFSNAKTLKSLDEALSNVSKEEFTTFIKDFFKDTKVEKAINFVEFGKNLIDNHTKK